MDTPPEWVCFFLKNWGVCPVCTRKGETFFTFLAPAPIRVGQLESTRIILGGEDPVGHAHRPGIWGAQDRHLHLCWPSVTPGSDMG